jgi:hypothetical protein
MLKISAFYLEKQKGFVSKKSAASFYGMSLIEGVLLLATLR